MRGRGCAFIFLLLIISSIPGRIMAEQERGAVQIYGRVSLVEIDDILMEYEGGLTEQDLRKLCADITSRYHSYGYTAFYVKRAVLLSGGGAELFFNESPVEAIEVKGVFNGKDIARQLFRTGDPFNENVLKGNISYIKKSYNLIKLNVLAERTDAGGIILKGEASAKTAEGEIRISDDPVYGAKPGAGVRFHTGMYHVDASAESSIDSDGPVVRKGTLWLGSDTIQDRLYPVIGASISEIRNYLDDPDGEIYGNIGIDIIGGGGLCSGSAAVKVLFEGRYNRLEDYYRDSKGVTFAGVSLVFSVSDISYRLDPQESFALQIRISSGWNYYSGTPVMNGDFSLDLSYPLFRRIYLTLDLNSFYTTERERFLEMNLFDTDFPVRGDDPVAVYFRGIAGGGIKFEVIPGVLFFTPSFLWGVYRNDEGAGDVPAPGLKASLMLGRSRADVSWFRDTGEKGSAGCFLFSITAGYL